MSFVILGGIRSADPCGTARTLLRAGDGEAVISACHHACLHVVEALLATRGIAPIPTEVSDSCSRCTSSGMGR